MFTVKGNHGTARKIGVALVVVILVLPIGALGASRDASSDRFPSTASRAGTNITYHGSITDGAGAAPPKAIVVAANSTDMSLVNASITLDGDYSMGIPPNDTYFILMFPFSGRFLDGWELHEYFPIGRFDTVADQDVEANFTIVEAHEIILNGTGPGQSTVHSSEFTSHRWSTGMNDTASFAVWTEVDDGTGNKLPSVIIPLGEKRDLWFQWEVGGFGRAMVSMDNLGQGYISNTQGAEIVEVNHHVARTQFFRMQDMMNDYATRGYTLSQRTSSYSDNATTAWENAMQSSGLDRTKKLDSVTKNSLYAIETMNLDRADQDIETFRKGDVNVTVVDGNGLPLKDVTIDYEQTSRDFLFGVFNTMEGAGIDRFRMMRDIGVNYATVGFYWHVTEPTEGNIIYDTINTTWGIQELTDMGYKVKAHALIYMIDMVLPDYMKAKNFTEFKTKAYQHVHDLVSTYKGHIDVWNVVNEANGKGASGGFTRPQVTELIKTGVQAIRDADPDGEIIVNNGFDWFGQTKSNGYFIEDYDDFTIPVHEYMDLLEAEGVDYDIVGQQMYNGGQTDFFEKYGLGQDMGVMTFDLGYISYVFDQLHKYDKPIHMTELSVSGSWNDSWKDSGYWHSKWSESVQAEFLRQFYTIGFSKENVEALTWWDLVDGSSFLKDGAFFDENLQPKEMYYALADLIDGWTTVGNGTTNESGKASFRGFAGDYNMTVTWRNLTKDLKFHLNETGSMDLFVEFENGTLKPDLAVHPWEVVVLDNDFKETGDIFINATINNEGERNATDITLRFMHKEGMNWTRIGDDMVIPVLDAGEYTSRETTWNATELYDYQSIRVTVDPMDEITELNETNNNVVVLLDLPRPGWGRLDVEVLENGTREPMANQSVTVQTENGTTYDRVHTDANGTFFLDKVPIGCYRIVVAKRDYLVSNVSACVDRVETTSVQVLVDRITWGHIIGTVFDDRTGKSIAGATVAIQDLGLSMETNLGGGFSFLDLPQEEYLLEASATDYLDQNISVMVEANRTVSADFHLKISMGDLSGTVRDNGTGEPIVNATVLIPNLIGQITDQDGRFFMYKIPVGEHDLEVGAAGYHSKTVSVDVDSGNMTMVDIVLEPIIIPPDPNGTISVFVFDKDTTVPIERANIYISELGMTYITDSKGYLKVSKVAPGNYTIEVTAKGYRGKSQSVNVGFQEDESLSIYLKKKGTEKDMEDVLGVTIFMLVFLIILVVFIALLYMRVKKAYGRHGPAEEEGKVGDDSEE